MWNEYWRLYYIVQETLWLSRRCQTSGNGLRGHRSRDRETIGAVAMPPHWRHTGVIRCSWQVAMQAYTSICRANVLKYLTQGRFNASTFTTVCQRETTQIRLQHRWSYRTNQAVFHCGTSIVYSILIPIYYSISVFVGTWFCRFSIAITFGYFGIVRYCYDVGKHFYPEHSEICFLLLVYFCQAVYKMCPDVACPGRTFTFGWHTLSCLFCGLYNVALSATDLLLLRFCC